MNRFSAAILIVALFSFGCETPDAKQPATAPALPMSLTITARRVGEGDPRDPQPELNAMVRLVIYLLDMPPGSVSNNREFWKRVDEQAVGTANADRLAKNGIRCGTVPRSEGVFFSQFFDKQPHKLSTSNVDGLHSDTFELEMEKQFEHQDLFFLNSSNQIEGKTYDHGVNQLMLSFGPTPRDPGAVRLTLCPVVRSVKTEMSFSPLNQELETPVNSVEHLYDLGLCADVSGDSFFIIAPNSAAADPTSIGGRFLIKADKTEKLEQVIVIVPTFMRLDGKPMRVRDALIRK